MCNIDHCIGCSDCRPLTQDDEDRIERALIRSGYPPPVATLHVVTMPQPKECDGSMVCECESCQADRSRIQPRRVRQPWELAA